MEKSFLKHFILANVFLITITLMLRLTTFFKDEIEVYYHVGGYETIALILLSLLIIALFLLIYVLMKYIKYISKNFTGLILFSERLKKYSLLTIELDPNEEIEDIEIIDMKE